MGNVLLSIYPSICPPNIHVFSFFLYPASVHSFCSLFLSYFHLFLFFHTFFKPTMSCILSLREFFFLLMCSDPFPDIHPFLPSFILFFFYSFFFFFRPPFMKSTYIYLLYSIFLFSVIFLPTYQPTCFQFHTFFGLIIGLFLFS